VVVERPDWDEQGMAFAKAASIRGDCTRRQVGAAILDKDHRIFAAGYNGSYRGGPSCLLGDCPRGRHYRADDARRNHRLVGGMMISDRVAVCGCGNRWPCPDAVAPGSSYDTGPGACIGVHAELNALLDVSERSRLNGATMYITDPPCEGCLKIIKNTAISRIVWPGGSYVR
jgi:dCMP deaminase